MWYGNESKWSRSNEAGEAANLGRATIKKRLEASVMCVVFEQYDRHMIK